MGVAVVVVPGGFVHVVAIFGGDFFEGGFEIVPDEPRFKLGGREGGGGTDHKNGGDTVAQAAALDGLGDAVGQVDDLVVSFGGYLEAGHPGGHERNIILRGRGSMRRGRGAVCATVAAGVVYDGRAMAGLDYRTAGESHGPAVTALVEGMPAGVRVDVAFINGELRRRQGGYGRSGRMKIEQDAVEVLAGVRHGETMGSPVVLQVVNRDRRLEDAPAVHRPRPGHADLAGSLKWLSTDCRGTLERASARETVARVAAGALARCLLREFDIDAVGYVVRIGEVGAEIGERQSLGALRSARDANEVYCPDGAASERMIAAIRRATSEKDTLGGVVEVQIQGAPPGLGSCMRWQDKLDGRLMQALGSIPAIKGVEIGMGFGAAARSGSRVHDEIDYDPSKRDTPTLGFTRRSNHAGGIEGGMTNGQTVVVRAAMKPISTLLRGMDSVNLETKAAERSDYERSDICAVAAASVVAENVAAFEMARAFLEKFGGDTLREVRAAYDGYLAAARSLGVEAE